ncbi:MAG TPA: helix-turn-helix domain-containing protein [Frankiaceae bacterium]|nr:helix-turn-helix domain-containing protein [Frankiaceae bacterium]
MAPLRPELRLDQIKALTHPLRLSILRELRANGPATATALGKRLGESSGSTSYHLRQLAKHGFVEELPDSGDARDRWWRPAMSGHRVEPARFANDPEQRAIVGVYQAQVVAGYAARMDTYVAEQSAGEWGAEWAEAYDLSDFKLRLTPTQLTRLVAKLHAVIESYGKYDAADGEEVVVQIGAFPRKVRPFEADQ